MNNPIHPMLSQFLASKRFPLSDEKRLQQAIEEEFQRAGILYSREVLLAGTERRDIIDFVIGDTGVEVKIKGGKLAIYRQLERYAEHDELACIVLVTNVAMGLPEQILGKPVYMVNLARAWL